MEFIIDFENGHWIRDDGQDDPDDLCLHGTAIVRIGEVILREEDVNLTVSAMIFLRTLTEDHESWSFASGRDGCQMLPEGGFSWFANDPQNVHFSGTPWGLDWTIRHDGNMMRMTLPDGQTVELTAKDYCSEVFRFADRIEAVYRRCLSKNLPADPVEREGCFAFANEWTRRAHHGVMRIE